MQSSTRSRLGGASALAVFAVAAAFLAGCASTEPKAMVNTKKRSKEYFAESEYGVKASPRVSNARSNLPRGGGRDQVGKPYMVRGKMYYPKEDANYRKVGLASWYGEAFHGRLTANGEVYDMTHLTAAHPTMPLPSYARVTNTENGNSVIVRVNDRGPYSNDRLIDLSSRAADLLDYKRSGTAKVKVEYVGRAPLHGNDDSYLLASYRPGNRAPDPSDGLPTGVMIAMNGPTPTSDGRASAFPGMMATSGQAAPAAAYNVASAVPSGFTLPDFGPIAPERPEIGLPGQVPFRVASLSYAPAATEPQAFAALMRPAEPAARSEPYVAAASFRTAAEAQALAASLAPFGRATVETQKANGETWYGVMLRGDGRFDVDAMLEAAWANGAAEAIAVRD
ncbi:MAG: septal ring lytic transglycosylase RlpA family protein [Rhizobiaceae bacterium]